jgi:RNA polymerase sigma-70 factor (sigma-E family)
MRADAEREYGDYVTARTRGLVRFAYLTCGDWHQAEDAVQAALTKLYLAWPRLQSRGTIDAYVRRIVLRAVIDQRRLSWFRREQSTDALPDYAGEDPTAPIGDRVTVLAALAKLPRRQRVVLVLRFWEDQSVEQVADLLGCSSGTVKSQSSRALDKLRRLLADPLVTSIGGTS